MRSFKDVLTVAALLLLAACGGGSDSGTNPEPTPPGATPPAGSVTVTAGANSDVFSPADVSVSVGGSVVWSFGPRAHNVIFAGVAGAPGNIPATTSSQVSRTFPTAGTFPYDCTLHPGMRGRVLVGTAAASRAPGN